MWNFHYAVQTGIDCVFIVVDTNWHTIFCDLDDNHKNIGVIFEIFSFALCCGLTQKLMIPALSVKVIVCHQRMMNFIDLTFEIVGFNSE